jgi:hypothetical protein
MFTPLLFETAGSKQKLNRTNAKGLLRIIQSIPSPKAEPFKQWLAQVGSDQLRISYIANYRINYNTLLTYFLKYIFSPYLILSTIKLKFYCLFKFKTIIINITDLTYLIKKAE